MEVQNSLRNAVSSIYRSNSPASVISFSPKQIKTISNDTQPSDFEVQSAVSQINKNLSKNGHDFSLRYVKQLNIMAVEVVDKKTQEVIATIPPKDVIRARIENNNYIGQILSKIA